MARELIGPALPPGFPRCAEGNPDEDCGQGEARRGGLGARVRGGGCRLGPRRCGAELRGEVSERLPQGKASVLCSLQKRRLRETLGQLPGPEGATTNLERVCLKGRVVNSARGNGFKLEEVAGPALPPGYKSSCSSEAPDSDDDSESVPLSRDTNRDSEEEIGDPAPKKPKRNQEDDDDGFFGPALPPGFKKQDDSPERPIIGPALPPGFRRPSQDTGNSRCSIGPSVSSAFHTQVTDSSEEEDDIIGPMPAKGPVESDVTKEFERRAQRMKEKLTSAESNEPKQITRESWMTELPPELKSFGFGPRTFKRRADDKSGDRSVWTDTPADRERKAKEREEAKKPTSKDDEEIVLSGRDKRLVEQVNSYNESKRSESLMDIHQKKLKSKASEEKNKPQERRPFDRDQDLKVHRFDEAQKKALIRKSRDLDSKFEHSKGNMFL